MFGNPEVIQADVVFRANWQEFTGDTVKIREAAERTYGALDNGSLKAALAQEKYDRALARSKGSSYAVAKATAAYKAELAALDSQQNRATSGSTRHSNALKQEERSLGNAARGAIAGSGALGHLGRAAIFASTSLLGGYGLIYALRSTIAAAREHEIALGHLDVALTNSGLSFARNRTQVEAGLDTLVKLTAFTKNELTEALASNVRRYGDIDQALTATAIAADVARGKNIALADAVGLVTRASFGQQRAARSLGVDVTAVTSHIDALRATTGNATKEQLANAKALDQAATRLAYLDAVGKAYHGNAANYLTKDAGKQAEFNAQLELSKEILGGALLPQFNQYLIKLTDWLEKMNRTGRLQHDVNRAVHDFATIAHDAGAVIGFVNHNLGGLSTLLEGLLAFKLASKLSGWAVGFGRIGRESATAEGKVASLKGSLKSLGLLQIAPILITVEVIGLEAAAKKIKALQEGYLTPESHTAPDSLKAMLVPKLAREYKLLQSIGGLTPQQAIDTIETRLSGKHVGPRRVRIHDRSDPTGAHDTFKTVYDQPTAEAADLVGDAIAYSHGGPVKKRIDQEIKGSKTGGGKSDGRGGTGGGGGGGGDSKLGGLPYSLQNALLEAQATPGTGDDVTVLNDQLAYLTKALAQKGLTGAERNQLLSERNDVLGQLQQIRSAQTQAAKSAAAAAARKQRTHFASLAAVPASLVKKLADDERRGAPEKTILADLHREAVALTRQERQLEKEHAPASYEAKIAKERESIHAHTQRVIAEARKKRIAKLDSIPTSLKLEEANAIANNASAERLLAIYKQEKKKLDEQLQTLKRIHATKEQILKNRESAAAVQKKINGVEKQQAGLGAALEREIIGAFEGLYGGASNVFTEGPGGVRTPGSNSGTTVEVHQHFPHPPTVDGHREAIYARHAHAAAFDG